jgi:hypothetical protein
MRSCRSWPLSPKKSHPSPSATLVAWKEQRISSAPLLAGEIQARHSVGAIRRYNAHFSGCINYLDKSFNRSTMRWSASPLSASPAISIASAPPASLADRFYTDLLSMHASHPATPVLTTDCVGDIRYLSALWKLGSTMEMADWPLPRVQSSLVWACGRSLAPSSDSDGSADGSLAAVLRPAQRGRTHIGDLESSWHISHIAHDVIISWFLVELLARVAVNVRSVSFVSSDLIDGKQWLLLYSWEKAIRCWLGWLGRGVWAGLL